MSDLFHDNVPNEFILEVFDVMRRAYWHTFQILTKRSDRLLQLDPAIDWSANIWMGVSVESNKYKFRIDDLRRTRAKVKFLSLEPLLGPLVKLKLKRIDWVIAGGESGPGARSMAQEWVEDIRNQCDAAGVSFFFKQWGGVRKSKTGRLLDGRTYDEMPECVQHPTPSRKERTEMIAQVEKAADKWKRLVTASATFVPVGAVGIKPAVRNGSRHRVGDVGNYRILDSSGRQSA